MSKRITVLEDVDHYEEFEDVTLFDSNSDRRGALNPRPQNKGVKSHRRVDAAGNVFQFRGKTLHFWEHNDRRRVQDHRVSVFQTGGKQIVIHYTAQCRAYDVYERNVIRVVSSSTLHKAANKPKGWRGWFHMSFESAVKVHITNDMPEEVATYIEGVLASLFSVPEDERVIHIE